MEILWDKRERKWRVRKNGRDRDPERKREGMGGIPPAALPMACSCAVWVLKLKKRSPKFQCGLCNCFDQKKLSQGKIKSW